MLIKVKNKETLEISEFSFKCCLGLYGKTNSKSEGDKKTPVGRFNLGPLFYRPDREKKPKTKLTCIKITKNMNWCNDSKSKKYLSWLLNLSSLSTSHIVAKALGVFKSSHTPLLNSVMYFF